MRWALVFAGVVLVGAVALASRGEPWAAVCLTLVGLLAMWIDAAWHGGAVNRAAALEAKVAALKVDMDRKDREIVERLGDRVSAMVEQVDRLNKANAFKGL
jgi:hypothetical protein